MTGRASRAPTLFALNFKLSSPLIGVVCALSIAVPLIVGIATGHTRAGGWGAVGAFLTNMAVFQPSHRFRARIVAGAAALVGLGGFLGALCGIHSLGIYPVVGIWTFAAGLFVAVGPTAALIGVSSATGVVYAASLRVSTGGAVEVGVVMTCSGLVTAGIALVAIPFVYRHFPQHDKASAVDVGRRWLSGAARSLRQGLARESTARYHALRMAVGVVAGTVLFRLINPVDGFWIPEAVLFIMRPDSALTKQRSLLRVVGSVAGVTLTTLLLTTLRPSADLMAVIAVVASAVAFSVQRVNFGLYITFVTCTFVFLTAFGGLPPASAVRGRLVDNLIGSAIAVLCLALWPTHET